MMGTVDEQFAGNKMQDATEFLLRLLDEIKKDIRRIMRIPKWTSDEFSSELSFLTYNTFLYEKEELLVCCSCEAETRCRNRDMSLWCNTTSPNNKNRVGNVSIQSLVEHSMAKETRLRRCPKCGCEDATVTSELASLPRVLIIFLKRYKYSNLNSSGKVSRPVDISETICLSSLVSDTVILPDTSLPDLLFPVQQTPLSLHPNPLLEYLKKKDDFASDKQQEYIIGNVDDLKAALETSKRDEQLTGEEESHSDVDYGQQVWKPSYSKAVKIQHLSFSSEGISQDFSILRTTPKELGEAGAKSALEQETESSKNTMADTVPSVPRIMKHTYQLHSVVSHFGTSAIAGHFVADVYRQV